MSDPAKFHPSLMSVSAQTDHHTTSFPISVIQNLKNWAANNFHYYTGFWFMPLTFHERELINSTRLLSLIRYCDSTDNFAHLIDTILTSPSQRELLLINMEKIKPLIDLVGGLDNFQLLMQTLLVSEEERLDVLQNPEKLITLINTAEGFENFKRIMHNTTSDRIERTLILQNASLTTFIGYLGWDNFQLLMQTVFLNQEERIAALQNLDSLKKIIDAMHGFENFKILMQEIITTPKERALILHYSSSYKILQLLSAVNGFKNFKILLQEILTTADERQELLQDPTNFIKIIKALGGFENFKILLQEILINEEERKLLLKRADKTIVLFTKAVKTVENFEILLRRILISKDSIRNAFENPNHLITVIAACGGFENFYILMENILKTPEAKQQTLEEDFHADKLHTQLASIDKQSVENFLKILFFIAIRREATPLVMTLLKCVDLTITPALMCDIFYADCTAEPLTRACLLKIFKTLITYSPQRDFARYDEYLCYFPIRYLETFVHLCPAMNSYLSMRRQKYDDSCYSSLDILRNEEDLLYDYAHKNGRMPGTVLLYLSDSIGFGDLVAARKMVKIIKKESSSSKIVVMCPLALIDKAKSFFDNDSVLEGIAPKEVFDHADAVAIGVGMFSKSTMEKDVFLQDIARFAIADYDRNHHLEKGQYCAGIGATSLGIFIDEDMKGAPSDVERLLIDRFGLGHKKFYFGYAYSLNVIEHFVKTVLSYTDHNAKSEPTLVLASTSFKSSIPSLLPSDDHDELTVVIRCEDKVALTEHLQRISSFFKESHIGILCINGEAIQLSDDKRKLNILCIDEVLPHETMKALIKASQELCLLTGDQSFSEGISGGKMMLYEEHLHKRALWQNFCYLGGIVGGSFLQDVLKQAGIPTDEALRSAPHILAQNLLSLREQYVNLNTFVAKHKLNERFILKIKRALAESCRA